MLAINFPIFPEPTAVPSASFRPVRPFRRSVKRYLGADSAGRKKKNALPGKNNCNVLIFIKIKVVDSGGNSPLHRRDSVQNDSLVAILASFTPRFTQNRSVLRHESADSARGIDGRTRSEAQNPTHPAIEGDSAGRKRPCPRRGESQDQK